MGEIERIQSNSIQDGLAKWFRIVLKDKGRSQTAMAESLSRLLARSIDKAAVNKMTLGKRAIGGDELLAIAFILDVSIPKLGAKYLKRLEDNGNG